MRCARASWCSRPAPGTTRTSPAEIGALDRHGNPNVLTHDHGTSRLAQATAAHSALVEVERWEGPAPEVAVHRPPEVVEG